LKVLDKEGSKEISAIKKKRRTWKWKDAEGILGIGWIPHIVGSKVYKGLNSF
jgi:hypothetical protein